jgi:sugar/nucleoside kinase (ribokinase family)
MVKKLKKKKTLRINGEPKQRVKINVHNVRDGRNFVFGDHKIEWNIGKISIIRKQKEKVVKAVWSGDLFVGMLSIIFLLG